MIMSTTASSSSFFRGHLRHHIDQEHHAESHKTLVDQGGNEFCLCCACETLSTPHETLHRKLSVVSCLHRVVASDAAQDMSSTIMSSTIRSLSATFGGDAASSGNTCEEKLKAALIALAGLLQDRADTIPDGCEVGSYLALIVHEVTGHGITAQATLLTLLGSLVARAKNRAEDDNLLNALCVSYAPFLERITRSAVVCPTPGPLCDVLYILSCAAMSQTRAHVACACLAGVADTLCASLERMGDQACWANGLTCFAALALAMENDEVDRDQGSALFEALVHASSASSKSSVRLGMAARAMLIRIDVPVAVCAAARMFATLSRASSAATRTFIHDGVADFALEGLSTTTSNKTNACASVIKRDLAHLLDALSAAEPLSYFHQSHFSPFALQALLHALVDDDHDVETELAEGEAMRGDLHRTNSPLFVSPEVARSSEPLARLLRRSAEHSTALDHVGPISVIRAIARRTVSLLSLPPDDRRAREPNCSNDGMEQLDSGDEEDDFFDFNDDAAAGDIALYECLLAFGRIISRSTAEHLPSSQPLSSSSSASSSASSSSLAPSTPSVPNAISILQVLRTEVRTCLHDIFVRGKLEERNERVLTAALYAANSYLVATNSHSDDGDHDDDRLWAFQLIFNETSASLSDAFLSLDVSAASTLAVFISFILEEPPSTGGCEKVRMEEMQRRRYLARQLCERGWLLCLVHNLSASVLLEASLKEEDEKSEHAAVFQNCFLSVASLFLWRGCLVSDGLHQLVTECCGVSLDTLDLKLVELLRRNDDMCTPAYCHDGSESDDSVQYGESEDDAKVAALSIVEVALFIVSLTLIPSCAWGDLDVALVTIVKCQHKRRSGSQHQRQAPYYSSHSAPDQGAIDARAVHLGVHILNLVGGLIHDNLQSNLDQPSSPSNELVNVVKEVLVPYLASTISTASPKASSAIRSNSDSNDKARALTLEALDRRAITFLIEMIRFPSHNISQTSVQPCEKLVWMWCVHSLRSFNQPQSQSQEAFLRNVYPASSTFSPQSAKLPCSSSLAATGLDSYLRHGLAAVLLAGLLDCFREANTQDLCRVCNLLEYLAAANILRAPPLAHGADQGGNAAVHCTTISGYLGSTIMVKRMHEMVSFASRVDVPIHSPKKIDDSTSTRDSHMFSSSSMRLAASLVTFECCAYVSNSTKSSSSSSFSSSSSSSSSSFPFPSFSYSSASRSGNLRLEGGSRRYEQNLRNHEGTLLGALLQCAPLLATVAVSSAANSVQAIVALNAIAAAASQEPHQNRSILDTMYTSHGAAVASIAMSCGDASQAAALSFLLLVTNPLPRESESEGHEMLLLPFFRPSQLIAAIPDRLVDDESQATTALALHLCARMIYGDHLISSFAKQQLIDTSAEDKPGKKRNRSVLDVSTNFTKGGDGASQKHDSWWKIGNGKTRTQVQLLAQHHALAPSTIVSEAACAALLVIRATILLEPSQASSDGDHAQVYKQPDGGNVNLLQTQGKYCKKGESCLGSRLFSLFRGSKAVADWSSGWHRVLCEEILGSVLSESTTGPFALLLLASTVRSRPCWIRDVFGTDSICLALLRSLKKACDASCVVEQRCYVFLFGCLMNAGLMTLPMISKLRDALKCLHQPPKHEDSRFIPMCEQQQQQQQQQQHREGGNLLSWACVGSKDLLIPSGIDWATGIPDTGARNAAILLCDGAQGDGEHILHPLQLEHHASIAADLLKDLSANFLNF